ncbi:glycine betaine ABC transporter substrate-binding protein [Demequina sp. SYSU T00039]|uniref:Glycine betaine ABC transporter substrate-binding protein n=1 Tax=Demequina lignilytica TaxID=3051663 RepID=A0AAW7MAC9_9MICO|nr:MULTISPECIES: glycine betaine ABC transporter substrate-binding protein [unclassified Demequina]MDN4479293.1 glycine betaine ABC transporter substrate-binding protein [Demequina sp. SYSU T00039-1]MDN4488752.1 glycine betaine ABC transporter substrate-binding protein [Demequina sp. SYSU T00039]MDN4490918.1 glycine betaine ABC transporter substrate-binding protein [Demequina sp. SYSU T00068]
MRIRTGMLAAATAATLVLAGCSSGSDSPEPAGSTSSTAGGESMAQECQPVPGDTFMVLDDDKMLQNSDNLIPAVNADAASDEVLGALDAVSAVLTTDDLIQLNKAVDIDRQTSAEAAAAYVADNGIAAPATGSGSIVVGAANFSENITVAEIYAAVLADAGFDTEVRTIGNRETYLPALQSGEIQVVPEYAATVTEYLNRDQNGAEAAAVASGDIDATVAALEPLATAAGLVFGEASAAQDQNAFAVTTAFSDEYGVTSLSELAETCGTISLGGPPECPERPFCQIGLEEQYGIEVAQFESLDPGGPLTKTAIQQGQVMVGLVFSSDGALG